MKSPAEFLVREPGFLALQRALDLGITSRVTGLFGLARLLVPLAATNRLLVFVTPHEKDIESLAGDAETLIPWLAMTGRRAPSRRRTRSCNVLLDGALRTTSTAPRQCRCGTCRE